MRKKSLAKIGLNAFMATAIKEPERGDEIISSLHLEDFAEAEAEKQYAKIILQSTSELDIAQVFFYVDEREKIMHVTDNLKGQIKDLTFKVAYLIFLCHF